ncbi:MAG: DUF1559 domain-containing protein [Planctomycetales bacterium]|nr:DUF1559 domain-containing protein [Planctomycetales bacterium]
MPKAIIKQRDLARSSACANNLKMIGLAFHNYHSAYKQLPAGTGGTTGNDDPAKSNQGMLGPLVGILPFAEQQALWEQISNPSMDAKSGTVFPSMGPIPLFDETVYKPWSRGPDLYRCPDAGPAKAGGAAPVIHSLEAPLGSGTVHANYVACYGDGTFMQGEIAFGNLTNDVAQRRMASNRGAFMTSKEMKFRDFLDGLSNTIMFSETVAGGDQNPQKSQIIRDVVGLSKVPALCLRTASKGQPQFWSFNRGARWCDGRPVYTGFQTVLPPNSPSCTSELGIDDPIVSASSTHAGGVQVLMADGAVVFISDSIDAGDSTKGGVAIGEGYSRPGDQSPYGLWGALGSRASKEIVDGARRDFVAVQTGQSPLNFSAPSRANLSVWTDRKTKTRLRAEFLEIRDKNTIRLKHSSGSIHEVPLQSLEPADVYRAIEMDVLRGGNK